MNDNLTIQSLKGFQVFKKIFDKKNIYSKSEALAAFSYVDEINLTNIINIGVAVPKKFAKRANVRNRIKRLLREALRFELQKTFVTYGFTPFDALIISWRNAPKKASLIKLADVLPFVEKSIEFGYNKYYKKNSQIDSERAD